MQRALWGGAALGAGVEKEPQMASLAGASKPDPHFPNPPSQSPAHFSDPQPNSPAPPSWLLPSPPGLPPHTLPHNPCSQARGRRAGTAVRGLEQGGLCTSLHHPKSSSSLLSPSYLLPGPKQIPVLQCILPDPSTNPHWVIVKSVAAPQYYTLPGTS